MVAGFACAKLFSKVMRQLQKRANEINKMDKDLFIFISKSG
jgi:hypothetical protein